MGLFSRKRRDQHHGETPASRESCSCREHVDDLTDIPVPLTGEMAKAGEEPMTVGELVDCDALGAEPRAGQDQWFFTPATGRRDDGPYHWTLWMGDETRCSYDDDAPLSLEKALEQQPGIGRVLWEDREVLHVQAPTLCHDGVLAAASRALLNPEVRVTG